MTEWRPDIPSDDGETGWAGLGWCLDSLEGKWPPSVGVG